jgi:DNA-binding GntR family transcriptional regulator
MTQLGLAEQIADSIVEGIATDVFASGDRLVEMDICLRLGVSRIPVREALRILEAQGVAVSLPRRGYRVAMLDSARLAQIHEVRVSLELLAARDAARRLQADPSLAAGLEQIVATMALRMERNEWSGPDAIDIAFHRELCRFSGNEIVRTLWEAIARHIRIIFGKCVDAHTDPAFLYKEHRILCDVLKGGDVDAVAAELRAHLRPTTLRDEV